MAAKAMNVRQLRALLNSHNGDDLVGVDDGGTMLVVVPEQASSSERSNAGHDPETAAFIIRVGRIAEGCDQ